jgi:hypothetical protein
MLDATPTSTPAPARPAAGGGQRGARIGGAGEGRMTERQAIFLTALALLAIITGQLLASLP